MSAILMFQTIADMIKAIAAIDKSYIYPPALISHTAARIIAYHVFCVCICLSKYAFYEKYTKSEIEKSTETLDSRSVKCKAVKK